MHKEPKRMNNKIVARLHLFNAHIKHKTKPRMSTGVGSNVHSLFPPPPARHQQLLTHTGCQCEEGRLLA